MKTFDLPDLGEGLQEAEIVTWHVGPGDHVVADQPLVSVETDKAVVEVPSPFGGEIAELFGKEGDIVKVGAPLVAFAEGRGADTGTVVGEVKAGDERAEEATAEERAGPAVTVKATPAVRALARRLGVDLALVSPSGPGGVITAKDVERAAESLKEAGPLEPLRGVRRAMAVRMAHAHAEVVPATVSDEADIEPWTDRGDVTTRLVRAIVAGCCAEPALNAWYDSKTEGRRLHRKIDLGIAVDTEDGLFVPVLRDIANRHADDLRRGLERMKADIRARSIPPEERSPGALPRRSWCRRRSRSSPAVGSSPGPWPSMARWWCTASCRCRSPSTIAW
jgi:2-oxoisovalerate dehydrogenase E2 component (dihydrolipoyl transacylase)